MDERTLVQAQAFNDRLIAAAIAKSGRTRAYTIIVRGHENEEPFTIEALSLQDCYDRVFAARGINLSEKEKVKYGLAYPIGDDELTFGNDDELMTRAVQEIKRSRC